MNFEEVSVISAFKSLFHYSWSRTEQLVVFLFQIYYAPRNQSLTLLLTKDVRSITIDNKYRYTLTRSTRDRKHVKAASNYLLFNWTSALLGDLPSLITRDGRYQRFCSSST